MLYILIDFSGGLTPHSPEVRVFSTREGIEKAIEWIDFQDIDAAEQNPGYTVGGDDITVAVVEEAE